jgi:hypothetical protein
LTSWAKTKIIWWDVIDSFNATFIPSELEGLLITSLKPVGIDHDVPSQWEID